ncbi:MAG: aldolase/citrate lyase family protein [Opitutales bacterium]
MTGQELATVLRSGQRAYGTLIVSTSPKWPESVRNSGLDFVFIDTEHIPIGRETLSWMCRTYAAMGLPPIVRIPSPSPVDACKVLDGGACGIVAPYVESAEQVRKLVGAVKLRPLKGKLAETALLKPDAVDPQLRDYLDNFSSGNVLIVNIESVPAIENLDAILGVPGLDAVLIGPHDLSVSMEIPEQYRDPAFDKAVRDVIKRARDKNTSVGIHFWEGLDMEIEWAKAGANLIIHSGDISLFSSTLRKDLKEMREVLGNDTQLPNTKGATVV